MSAHLKGLLSRNRKTKTMPLLLQNIIVELKFKHKEALVIVLKETCKVEQRRFKKRFLGSSRGGAT